MSTDVLTLTQWLSPGFPVGAFAYSHGLETAIADGRIASVRSFEAWLHDLVAFGGGRADIVLLGAAYRAVPEDVPVIDATARAFAASAGRLRETADQGQAFCRTVDAIWHTRLGALCYPVAVGRAASERDLSLDLTAALYLQAFAANLVSAAVRRIPLGQTEGQDLLARMAPLVTQTVDDAMGTPLTDLTSACFAADIAAMQHETLYSKVFRT
ncbi:urease accessory UreF family protein [uncultured Roseobacter sp.]|uniref:urease accessory protein UreF n=1 Tax=uncultured Roseobacter sp. TaxID=114847 RepID=UPI00263887D3|nr:urease accessory UreF family protein [uncultured Roseobacter sp.]